MAIKLNKHLFPAYLQEFINQCLSQKMNFELQNKINNNSTKVRLIIKEVFKQQLFNKKKLPKQI